MACGVSTAAAFAAQPTYIVRAKPLRLRDHLSPYWDRTSPYSYRLHGSLVLPKGLGRSVCGSGAVAITVTHGAKTLARARVHVRADCTYGTRFVFTRMGGSGRLAFHFGFTGSARLVARKGRTLNVLYGPHRS